MLVLLFFEHEKVFFQKQIANFSSKTSPKTTNILFLKPVNVHTYKNIQKVYSSCFKEWGFEKGKHFSSKNLFSSHSLGYSIAQYCSKTVQKLYRKLKNKNFWKHFDYFAVSLGSFWSLSEMSKNLYKYLSVKTLVRSVDFNGRIFNLGMVLEN